LDNLPDVYPVIAKLLIKIAYINDSQ